MSLFESLSQRQTFRVPFRVHFPQTDFSCPFFWYFYQVSLFLVLLSPFLVLLPSIHFPGPFTAPLPAPFPGPFTETPFLDALSNPFPCPLFWSLYRVPFPKTMTFPVPFRVHFPKTDFSCPFFWYFTEYPFTAPLPGPFIEPLPLSLFLEPIYMKLPRNIPSDIFHYPPKFCINRLSSFDLREETTEQYGQNSC